MKQYGEKYKEIFRYLSLGISRNEISKLLKTSRKTIRKVHEFKILNKVRLYENGKK